MGSIAYALAAGNAVVFKPSEFTPAVGGWLVSSFAEVVPEQPVLQLVTGSGETGQAAWPAAGSTRSPSPGRRPPRSKVMAACAENLTPMVAECGGKDAFLVAADADLDAAADAAAWGALSNAGPDLHRRGTGLRGRRGLPHVPGEAGRAGRPRLRPGDDREADYGPMTMPGQIEIIERHIADALARGGRPVVGGLASIRRPYVGPVILADVPEESRAVTEETFGPTLTVTRVGRPGRGGAAGQRQPLRRSAPPCSPRTEARAGRGARAAAQRDDLDQLGDHVRQRARAAVRRAAATPGSAGSTARTGCGSSPGPRRSPGSGCGPLANLTTFRRTDKDLQPGPAGWSPCCTASATASTSQPALPAPQLSTRRLRSAAVAASWLGRPSRRSGLSGRDAGPACQRGAAADQVGGPLGDGDDRRVRVAPRHAWASPRRPPRAARSTPRTRSSGSTTLVSLLAARPASPPIAQVPTGWNSVPSSRRMNSRSSTSVRTSGPGASSAVQILASGPAAANSRAIRSPLTSGSMSAPSDR